MTVYFERNSIDEDKNRDPKHQGNIIDFPGRQDKGKKHHMQETVGSDDDKEWITCRNGKFAECEIVDGEVKIIRYLDIEMKDY